MTKLIGTVFCVIAAGAMFFLIWTISKEVALRNQDASRFRTLERRWGASIAAENALPGNPESEWGITGLSGDKNIQGFATEISVDQGDTIYFKIETDSPDYRLDIYRMGYYQGNGARLVDIVQPSATLPQPQPACLFDPVTKLTDCGNWSESASWNVPTEATSGIYFAKLVREDAIPGASHIFFVVRDDDGASDILFQTSDTTWHAYNLYGGYSLYQGPPSKTIEDRASMVSYNRPFWRVEKATWIFNAEYPMVRWLEANGYDVSYTTGVDSHRFGSEILEHSVFLSVGHDEYWSNQQRLNVEAARDSGVNLAFFSGNEIFWKTRFIDSIDATATPHRTLVSYKETHDDAKTDPLPDVWTGTWMDPRFSPPADGARPQNALTGQLFTVNGYTADPLDVPAEFANQRFWRNTSVANLQPGKVGRFLPGMLGYEWDSDVDNGFRPAGLVPLSSTTVIRANVLQDFGSEFSREGQSANHKLTMYRAASGALVFGAGTVQWSWGLDNEHSFDYVVADDRLRQATVNLLADMGVFATTLDPNLVAATQSTDTRPPTSVIQSPVAGRDVRVGQTVTISGVATDVDDGVIGVVEVSTDGGLTWHRAVGRETWTYDWVPDTVGAVSLLSRAADDSANLGPASAAVVVNSQ